MPVFFHVLMWGVIVASTAGAKDFKGLITARFFLGIFEATVGEPSVPLPPSSISNSPPWQPLASLRLRKWYETRETLISSAKKLTFR